MPSHYLPARLLPGAFLIPLWSTPGTQPATAMRVMHGERVLVRWLGHSVMLRAEDRVLVVKTERTTT